MAIQRPETGLSKRSSREWAICIAMSLVIACTGYGGVSASLANVTVRADPALAHALAPWNGAVTAAYAQEKFLRQSGSDSQSAAGRLAALALLQDATTVEALTVLGFQARLQGDVLRSDAVFSYSSQLSRRELRPQIWAIEEAINRGDIAAALQHFDIALRTSQGAQELLFPVLASALAEPKIRSLMLPLLAKNPLWNKAFFNFLATSGIEPRGAAQLFLEGKRIGLTVDGETRAQLVDALFGQAHFNDAWKYYETLRPGVDRLRARDPDFNYASDSPTVFDWTTANEPGLSVAILASPEGGLVEFAAAPSAGGIVLQQSQVLPPGTYRLQGRSNGIEQPERSRPYLSLNCQDGRELGRVPLPNSSEEGGSFTASLTVPQGCPAQTLSMFARPSSESSGVSGQIEHLKLSPAI